MFMLINSLMIMIIYAQKIHFSHFTKEIIIYISGFVVHKLTSSIHCDICIKSLCSFDKESFLNSLITLKIKAETYRRNILICFHTEKILKNYDYQNKAVNTLKIQSEVLKHFLFNPHLLNSLKSHSTESSP